MGFDPVALYSAVLEDVGHLVSRDVSPTPKQFAATYLLDSVIRKWIPEDTTSADAAAKSVFVSANNRCRDWRFSPEGSWDEQLFGDLIRIFDRFLHPNGEPLISSYFDLLSFSRPGPGVNIDAVGTSYYTKYLSSPLTTSSTYLYEEYRRYASWIPFLSDAESLRYDRFGGPRVVDSSRSLFVPKTTKGSRMICVEPSVNMYYQLGLAYHLEERLRSFFKIDLKTQPSVNHRLARLGSIDGSYATIDLSSASDSVSLRLLDMICPRWFFDLLIHLRSRKTSIDGQIVPLYMVSTMGNGFTFPLQTCIFSSIVMACNINSNIDAHDFSVFGDDIIVRKEVFPVVMRLLRLLNFEANPLKTFNEGPFRESCGADWFSGQPVRPVFVKKLATPFDFMVAINQLNDWSAYTGIPLRNSVQLLLSHLGRKFLTFVPFEANFDAGIRVPLAFISPKYDSNQSFLYKSWERKPSRIRIYEEGIRTPNGFRGKLYFNPPGLYCSFLFGELVTPQRSASRRVTEVGTIMTRHRLKLFRSKMVCSPRWDYIPAGSLTNGVRLSWRRWETAVWTNLHSPQ